MDAALEAEQGSTTRIMLVDDEPSILKALRRTLFDLNCEVQTADSAQEALTILQENPADIVVSDMRMPGMDGAEFLTEVATQWPDSERILLTGYSDMESTIAAINKGKINYYLEKPWDDERLRKIINRSIDLIDFRHRNELLEKQVQEQNEQLKAWNEKLEQQVEARTQELNEANSKLQNSVTELKEHYQTTIQLFSNLIDQRLGRNQTNSRTFVSALKRLAEELKLSKKETNDLTLAGVLRNMGKLGLADTLLDTPYLELSPEQQREFHRHTTIAETILSGTPPLLEASKILAQREEHEDGSGYPSGLSATDISLSAAALCVVADYFGYCNGVIDEQPLTPNQALSRVKELAGQYYRQEVVDKFETIWPELSADYQIQSEDQLRSGQLKAGMVLSRDLRTASGTLLLAEGKSLDDVMIERLKKLEKQFQEELDIYIQDENA